MPEIIFTNHLLERSKQRGISEVAIRQTISHPHQVVRSSTTHNPQFIRHYQNQSIHVVVKKETGKWLVLSTWTRPLENDRRLGSRGRFMQTRQSSWFIERLVRRFVNFLEKFIRRSFNR